MVTWFWNSCSHYNHYYFCLHSRGIFCFPQFYFVKFSLINICWSWTSFVCLKIFNVPAWRLYSVHITLCWQLFYLSTFKMPLHHFLASIVTVVYSTVHLPLNFLYVHSVFSLLESLGFLHCPILQFHCYKLWCKFILLYLAWNVLCFLYLRIHFCNNSGIFKGIISLNIVSPSYSSFFSVV